MNCPSCGRACESRFCPDCGALVAGAAQPGAAGGAVYPPLPGPPPAVANRWKPWSSLRRMLVFGSLAGLVVGLLIAAVVVLTLGSAPGVPATPQLPPTPRPALNQPGNGNGPAATLPDDSAQISFDEDAVLEQIEIFEYRYDDHDSPVVLLVLTNNSPEDVYISIDLNAYGLLGNPLAAKNHTEDAFDSGATIVAEFWLEEDYATSSYSISVSPNTYTQSLAQNLSYSLSEGKDKLLLSITNNGQQAAGWVRGHLLFFKAGRLVQHDVSYFGDSNYELAAGHTLTREYYISPYSAPEYDDVQVILVATT